MRQRDVGLASKRTSSTVTVIKHAPKEDGLVEKRLLTDGSLEATVQQQDIDRSGHHIRDIQGYFDLCCNVAALLKFMFLILEVSDF
jgi:hypothetical protein